MNLNLPTAYVLSCMADDIEANDYTLLIPALPGLKVSDVVFIGDSENGYVYAETMVKAVDDSNIELLVTASLDDHPSLEYSHLISHGIIPDYIFGGYEKLSNEGFIYLRSIFRDPGHY